MPEIDDLFRSIRQGAQQQVIAYEVDIHNDPDDEFDDLYVTIMSDPSPRSKFKVRWRPEFSASGPLARSYPRSGDTGMVIFVDEGPPWLVRWSGDSSAVAAETAISSDAPTPYVKVVKSGQALGTATWAVVAWSAMTDNQADAAVLTPNFGSPQHILVGKAGLYTVQMDVTFSVGTGDHLIFIGRNDAATPIVIAGGDEIIQARLGAMSNAAAMSVSAPFRCAVGDKLHGQAWGATAGQTLTATMRVTRIGN